jgi:dienelactone hydrolase
MRFHSPTAPLAEAASHLSLFLPLPAVPLDTQAQKWLASVATPEFRSPPAAEDWETQRAEIRRSLWRLLGDLPPRPAKPQVQIVSTEDGEGYRLERFVFDNGAGAVVPGLCFIPKDGGPRHPAILYCHCHGEWYDIGKQELLQTHAAPVPPGPTLARLGYVVLGIDAYCFGERNGQGPGGSQETDSLGELTAAKFQLWAGRSLWGMMVRDDLMALDYLTTRDDVDAFRIGVTGLSMGSTRAWWLMALDDRPKCGVCVACMTRYRDLIREEMLSAHGIYYFVPGMLQHFDTEAVIALCGPPPHALHDRRQGQRLTSLRRQDPRSEGLTGLPIVRGTGTIRNHSVSGHRPCVPAGHVGADCEVDGGEAEVRGGARNTQYSVVSIQSMSLS